MSWADINRGLVVAAERLTDGGATEDFQAVGHHCREVLISAGQALFDPRIHADEDGVPSSTDAEAMLEAFLAEELGGKTNINTRGLLRAVWKLAVGLQHKRTATYRDAAICLEATSALVKILSVVAGETYEPPPRREVAEKFRLARQKLLELVNDGVELTRPAHLRNDIPKCTAWHDRVAAFAKAALTEARLREFLAWRDDARRVSLDLDLHQRNSDIRRWLEFYIERLRKWVNGQLTEHDVDPEWLPDK